MLKMESNEGNSNSRGKETNWCYRGFSLAFELWESSRTQCPLGEALGPPWGHQPGPLAFSRSHASPLSLPHPEVSAHLESWTVPGYLFGTTVGHLPKCHKNLGASFSLRMSLSQLWCDILPTPVPMSHKWPCIFMALQWMTEWIPDASWPLELAPEIHKLEGWEKCVAN